MTLENCHHTVINFNFFLCKCQILYFKWKKKKTKVISLHLLDDWTSNLNFGGKNPQKNTLLAFSFFVMSQICAGYCCARLAQTGSFRLLLYPLYGLSQLTLQGSLFATTGWVKAREKSWPPAK